MSSHTQVHANTGRQRHRLQHVRPTHRHTKTRNTRAPCATVKTLFTSVFWTSAITDTAASTFASSSTAQTQSPTPWRHNDTHTETRTQRAQYQHAHARGTRERQHRCDCWTPRGRARAPPPARTQRTRDNRGHKRRARAAVLPVDLHAHQLRERASERASSVVARRPPARIAPHSRRGP